MSLALMMHTVLLVDDDVIFRERLARAMESRGCHVLQAAGLEEAEQCVGGRMPEAAVVDLRLPGSTGLGVIRRLRELCPGVRIVMLTGYGSIATALEAVRLGAADYLTKPADADEILSKLNLGLGQRIGFGAEGNPVVDVPTLARAEWEHLQRVLADCEGNISQAARVLGIDRRSLQRKLAKYPPTR